MATHAVWRCAPAAPSPHARVRRCTPRYARDSQPARTSFAACSRWPLRCSRSSSESTWLGRVTVRLRVRVRARSRVRVRVRVRLSQQRREHRELRALLGGLIRSLIRSLVNHCEYHCHVSHRCRTSHGARAACTPRSARGQHVSSGASGRVPRPGKRTTSRSYHPMAFYNLLLQPVTSS